MSSTGGVAIFIPVVFSAAHEKSAVPADDAAHLRRAYSAAMTLAPPPNMAVNSALLCNDLPVFVFFTVTPIGYLVLPGVGS